MHGKIYNSITELIGNTPLVRLNRVSRLKSSLDIKRKPPADAGGSFGSAATSQPV